MVDFCTGLFGVIVDRSSFLRKIGFYAMLRFFIKSFANICVPVYFRLTRSNSNYSISVNKKFGALVVVSMTTFPGRINKVWLVIECMFRQTYKPDRIILWLSKDQFNDISLLPERLLQMRNRGLEIVLCDGDLRSHKKYFYTQERYPSCFMVTVDDDFFYPSSLVVDLIELHKKYPDSICCDRALRMATNGSALLPYKRWSYVDDKEGPSFRLFHTSGGGVLYPPGSLSDQVLEDEVFMSICQYADDVWLNAMAQMKNSKTVKTASRALLIPIIFGTGSRTLTTVNVGEGLNDVQLSNVREFYLKRIGYDPFRNVFLEAGLVEN